MVLWSLVTLFSLVVNASPVVHTLREEPHALQQRTNVTVDKCSPSSPDGIQPECWEVLEMNNHLNDWWSKNSERCKSQNKGFGQCYLDTAGLITWSCDFVALNGCTPPPSGRNAEYASYQEFYVSFERLPEPRSSLMTPAQVISINLFFTNYHAALLQGQATAIGTVAEIVKVVAPPKDSHPKTPLFAPIYAVTLGQFAAFGPLFGAWIPGAIMFNSLAGVLGGGIGLYNILFPNKPVYQVPWEGLSEALSQHVNDYQKQVGDTLTEIQTDFKTFAAITSQGAFSVKMKTDLPENTDFMFHNLLKWVFNQALQQADYFAVKNPGVDPRLIPIDPYDCSKLDDHSTCGPIWYDGKDAYGLARANDIGMDRMQEILGTAFSKNWTTPRELYIDSQECQGKNGSDAFDVKDLSLSCASNIPVCEFNFDYNPYQALNQRNNPPEFINCPDQRGYGVPMFWSSESGVPLTYLGPFLVRIGPPLAVRTILTNIN
ncbi:uncharacterized protein CTRU02_205199 [Colletotrichum truncatum]|uniref:Uncharacterized protein n=1 Tax=Colletotrichum truncatum TaxID=5467 RepID=A0ACC3Z3E6_COLTU